MGTGGVFPTTITQTVSFFNTSGVIEKEHHIYYCPKITGIGGGGLPIIPARVDVRWVNAFRAIMNYNADDKYQNIQTSIWKPEDRTLVIKGDVDDFRRDLGEGYGRAFNYMLLRIVRNVVENNVTTTQTYYKGYFIESAEQIGNGSVRINVEPDSFTNAFYLFSNVILRGVADVYDPFNTILKNTYIERQHYDRIKLDEAVSETFSELTARKVSGLQYKITLNLSEIYPNSIISLDTFDIEDEEVMSETEQHRIYINEGNYIFESTFEVETDLGNTFVTESQLTIFVRNILENNLDVFSRIEETFKYKRQYRDFKEYLNEGEMITEAEWATIASTNNFANLSNTIKNKVLKYSTAFLTVTFKDNKIMFPQAPNSDGELDADKVFRPKLDIPNTNGVKEKILKIVCPIPVVPDKLSKYKSAIYSIFANITVKIPYGTSPNIVTWESSFYLDVLKLINSDFLAQYILTAFITREHSLKNNIQYNYNSISVNVDRPTVDAHDTFSKVQLALLPMGSGTIYEYTTGRAEIDYLDAITEDYMGYDIQLNGETSKADIIARGRTKSGAGESIQAYKFRDAFNTMYNNGDIAICLVETTDRIDFRVNLQDKAKDTRFNFYDPVLSFAPYSFYSISYLGHIESVLNKFNYYEHPSIKLSLVVNVSEAVKYSVIPTYTIDGKDTIFYSESLEQTVVNQISVLNDKLNDFVINNQSQMKNQFAVNDEQISNSLMTSAGSSAFDIGGSALTPFLGLFKAGASGLKSIGNLLTTAITGRSRERQIEMTQKAKLADLGRQPANVKQVGSDINTDLVVNEMGIYLNHYRIDNLSYNSICKYLERYGYLVNIYDTINSQTRKGWNYVKLVSFEFNANLSSEVEQDLIDILTTGVTLLHDKQYMDNEELHNYETILD